MSDNKSVFDTLTDSLAEKLPTQKGGVDKLKDMIAIAEAHGVVVSQYLRVLQQTLDEETAEAFKSVPRDTDKKKYTADEKKAIVAAAVAKTNAKMGYVKNLENLIKRRCSLGQSLLKSINEERE